MMPGSGKDVQHPGYNAAQVLVDVCKPFSSDEDLEDIDHVVVLHCTQNAGVLPPSASLLKVS